MHLTSYKVGILISILCVTFLAEATYNFSLDDGRFNYTYPPSSQPTAYAYTAKSTTRLVDCDQDNCNFTTTLAVLSQPINSSTNSSIDSTFVHSTTSTQTTNGGQHATVSTSAFLFGWRTDVTIVGVLELILMCTVFVLAYVVCSIAKSTSADIRCV